MAKCLFFIINGVLSAFVPQGTSDSLGLHVSAVGGLEEKAGLYVSAIDADSAAAHTGLLQVEVAVPKLLQQTCI